MLMEHMDDTTLQVRQIRDYKKSQNESSVEEECMLWGNRGIKTPARKTNYV